MVDQLQRTQLSGASMGAWMQELFGPPVRTGSVPMVALVGPSGSGKSTLARHVGALAGATVVHQDEFLIPRDERRSQGLLAKYDRDEFERVIARLLAGRAAVYVPFDPRDRCRVGRRVLEPTRLLVVEGIVALFSPLVRVDAGTRIYVDAPTPLREQRQAERLDREGQYRGVPRAELLAEIAAKKTTEDPLVRRQLGFCQWLLETSGPMAIPIPVQLTGDHRPTAA